MAADKQSEEHVSDGPMEEAHSIDVVSTDKTAVSTPKAKVHAKTKTSANIKGTNVNAHFKTKSKIHIQIPLPWKRLSFTPKTLCSILVVFMLIVMVSGMAGVGVYFLTKKSSHEKSVARKGADTNTTVIDLPPEEILVPNLKKMCDKLLHDRDDVDKKCLFTKSTFFRNCDLVPCSEVTYRFEAILHDRIAVIRREIWSPVQLTPSLSAYCAHGKWCQRSNVMTKAAEWQNFTGAADVCRLVTPNGSNDVDTSVKPPVTRRAVWRKACSTSHDQCLKRDDKDADTEKLFTTFLSMASGSCESLEKQCENEYVEIVPQVNLLSCNMDPNGVPCEGLPVYVSPCKKCPNFKRAKLQEFLSSQCNFNVPETLTSGVCFFDCPNNTTVTVVLPNGSSCGSLEEQGYCILGMCLPNKIEGLFDNGTLC